MTKLEGIVISSIDYKETSKIVNLYTKNGKIGVKAVGAKKPKNGALGFITTGNIVEFISTDSNLPQLIEYNLIDSFLIDDMNLDTFKALGIIINVINNLPVDINHNQTYNFIKNTLINLKKYNPKKVLSIFLIKILYSFGVSPNLKTCVNCGSKDIKFFDPLIGGALCENCAGGVDKTKLDIWVEYYYDKKDIDLYTDLDYDLLLKDIYKYYDFHMHFEIKSKF